LPPETKPMSEKEPQATFSHQQEGWRGRSFCAT
jgi:hypothetical protein